MTRKNPYENQEETLDIPDFVEEKTADTSGTVDMSIFKMSDEELYDDAPEAENEETERKPAKKKKGNGLLIFSLIVNLLLLAACAGAVFYALNQHNAYVKANTENQQIKAAQDTLKQQIAEKDALIENLNKQIEEKGKSSSGEGDLVYVIVDGGMYFRKEPTSDAEKVTYNNSSQALTGEEYHVIEVVNDKDIKTEPIPQWAKIADGVYFCIGTEDDVWAEKAD